MSADSYSDFLFSDLLNCPVDLLCKTPRRLTEVNSWHGHIPFAFWIIEKLRPRVFVELGVHKGDSYSAFCQAMEALPGVRCFGIDSWKGDEHASFYGEEVYKELHSYHEKWYRGFSTLIRSTFDEALERFSDGSIDLLHIDGRHTYEDVKHDFEMWRPKLSSQGVVLFHDINVVDRGFGVWRFFEELSKSNVGKTFSFSHSHGLGLILVGDHIPNEVSCIFDLSEASQTNFRNIFAVLGGGVGLGSSSSSGGVEYGRAIPEKERQSIALMMEGLKNKLACLMVERASLIYQNKDKESAIYSMNSDCADLVANIEKRRHEEEVE